MSTSYDYRSMYGSYPYPSMGMASPMTAVSPMAASPMAAMPQGAAPTSSPFFFPPPVPNGAVITPSGATVTGMPGREESYVENILRMNRGKMATFYMTYENNKEWNAKIFRGIIEAAGRDHIIISDPSTGMRYLLLTLNLDYVTFDGPINYQYQFQGQPISNVTPVQEP